MRFSLYRSSRRPERAGEYSPPDAAFSCRIDGKLRANEELQFARLAFVKKHALLAGAHCLDIGAEVGFYLHQLAGAGAVVRGIEPSFSNRFYAQEKFALTLTAQTCEETYWQEDYRDSFDQASLWDVIEHVNFPAATLASTFNLLKPGGWLFLDTPSRDSLYYRISAFVCRSSQGRNAKLLNTLYSSARYGHKQIFRPRQLAQLLQKTGFDLVTMKGVYDLAHPTRWA